MAEKARVRSLMYEKKKKNTKGKCGEDRKVWDAPVGENV